MLTPYPAFALAMPLDDRMGWLLFGGLLGAAAVVLFTRVLAQWYGKRMQ
ncbi:MAG TPA: hypothetical protein VM597_04550 [Gemmataceae bacterium]|nr:hypothetical protein [Gemmataceae bacterium]